MYCLHLQPITQNTNIFSTEDGSSMSLQNAGAHQKVTTQKKKNTKIHMEFLILNSNRSDFTTTFLEALNNF
jgi:hypothetical protein